MIPKFHVFIVRLHVAMLVSYRMNSVRCFCVRSFSGTLFQWFEPLGVFQCVLFGQRAIYVCKEQFSSFFFVHHKILVHVCTGGRVHKDIEFQPDEDSLNVYVSWDPKITCILEDETTEEVGECFAFALRFSFKSV